MPAFLKSKRNQLLIGSLVLIVLVILTYLLFFQKNQIKNTSSSTPTTQTSSSSASSSTTAESVTWQWSGTEWISNGKPPNCPAPLLSELPVDINLVTAILYPGQKRGGDYKAHGGFRFGNDNTINVTTPLGAEVVEGSRYIEGGEVQYMFTFINFCGTAYRFDHLHTLSEKFQKLADQLPEAKVDDSRTTPFNPPVGVTKGETVATKVGFVKTKNVSVDFGVYDLRKPNEASKNVAFAAAHENSKQYIFYGICWLKELPNELSQKVLAIPGSGTEGKTSDYCK